MLKIQSWYTNKNYSKRVATTRRNLSYTTGISGYKINISEMELVYITKKISPTYCGKPKNKFINDSIPPLLRKQDTPIMEKIITKTQKENQLIKFNRVIIYLGIYSIAEIVTADGLKLDREAWTGGRKRFTNQLWSYQERPDPTCIQIWRRLLATTFLKGHRPRVAHNTKDLHLQTPMGSWLKGSAWMRRKCEFFYSNQTRTMYQIDTNTKLYDGYECIRRSRHNTTTFELNSNTTHNNIPNNVTPAEQ